MSMRIRQRAYTFAELLVIVAIIAIIAAITIPLMASRKASAQRTTCLTRLRQVGAAMALYSASADDQAPYDVIERDPTSQRIRRKVWDLLAPYMVNREPCRCPDLPWEANDLLGYGYSALPVTFGSRVRTPLRFGPSSVVAFCWDHLEGEPNDAAPELGSFKIDRNNRLIGRFNVVRQDNSAASIDAKRVEPYVYLKFDRTWHPVMLQPNNMKYAQAIMRFPGEPWPAEFQSTPSPLP